MKFELVPMLADQRRLYDLPRGWERFNQYIATVTGGTDDIGVPLWGVMNPMGKDHVAATYDALLALDAETIAAAALTAAQERLAHVPGQFRVGLTVADDVGGGWTNRYAGEMGLRFAPGALQKRGWIVVPLWTGEQQSVEKVRESVLLAVFRMAYGQQHGWPTTLRHMLRQESAAAAFAGVQQTLLDPDELAYTRGVLAPLLDTTHYPTQFAALWGDEAAAMFGYQALGLSPYAGIALAIHEAEERLDREEVALAPALIGA